ncbi:MAG: bifunctional 3-(3-hydroxy-phenyl)propionate/3-hydroxycinnamic acid hydroxylase [Xenococcaceae cyanobacterium MO_207.B15]|nr:bifunctional 3-(3-hydroxy-phenyl)propionate/3-hydroxycinnamic acid hydroxylase [Xenococcaceae cyanobacterium MO_207.B15]
MNHLVFDVAIVGYGPVGVIAANLLGKYGIKTVVFERETDVYHLPRAIGFNHEIMRIFQQIGLYKQIESVATPVDGVEFLNRSHQVLFEIELSKTCLTHGFSPNYVFYQPDLETKLREGVNRFDCVTVHLGHTVEGIFQDQEGVTVNLRQRDCDRTYQVRVKYVLGCDGARSTTRQLAGIKLHDFGFHQRQLVVDTLLTEKVNLPSKVQQLCDTRRPGVFVHSTNNHRRWEFVLDKNEIKEEMERTEKVRELLSTYWIDPNKLKIIRAVVYHFHSLIALQWRNERIFIVGDAAHQMPPILGQGMCSGIRDAQNLCWKLDLVLRGLAPDKLLDTYKTERLPHVQEIVKLATRAFKIFKTRNPIFALVRDTMLRIVQGFTSKTKFQNLGSDMPPLKQGILASSADGKQQSVAGQMFIQPQVLTYTGELVLLDRVLGTGFAILGLNNNWLDVITPESKAFLSSLSTKFVCVVPAGAGDRITKFTDEIEVIEDTSNQITDWLAKQQKEIVIIRPDRYVFGVGDRDSLNSIVTQLQSLLIGDRPILQPVRSQLTVVNN